MVSEKEDLTEVLTEDLDELRRRTLVDCDHEFTTIRGVQFPAYFKNFEKNIENFEVRNDDTWVCTYPKAGSTWMQEMTWCIGNDLNFERANDLISRRFPFLEVCSFFSWDKLLSENDFSNWEECINSVEYAKTMSSPRFIKTHLPFQLLPRQLRTFEKRPQIIYVTRNSKDSCISYYYHHRLYHDVQGSFEDFCKLFLGSKLRYGYYWEHIKNYWEHKDQENILFLKYEDMIASLPSVIRKTSNFMNKKLNDHQVTLLAAHLTFGSMKRNPAVNYENPALKSEGSKTDKNICFIRKGEVGQWKTEMTQEFIDKFDKEDEKYRKETGFDF